MEVQWIVWVQTSVSYGVLITIVNVNVDKIY